MNSLFNSDTSFNPVPRKPAVRLPESQQLMVVEDYMAGDSMLTVGKRYGVSRSCVQLILKRHDAETRSVGCPRTYTVNESAFDNAEDSEHAAFFVGLLMADGSIIKNKYQMALSIALSGDDGHLVHDLRDFLGSNLPIRSFTRKPRMIVGSFCHTQEQHELRICSKPLCASLERYGMVPRKSLTAKVSVLEGNRHFWRGVICGDGSITIRSRHGHDWPSLMLVGSAAMIDQYLTYCSTFMEHKVNPTPNGKIWRAGFDCRQAIVAITHFFADATIVLKRKGDLAARAMALEWESPRSWMHLTAEELLAKKAELGNWQAVARAYDMNNFILRYTRRRLGIYEPAVKDSFRSHLSLTREMVQSAWNEGGTLKKAAAILGVPWGSMAYLKKRFGV